MLPTHFFLPPKYSELGFAYFSSTRGAIAAKYASQPHVIFGLMNQVSATTGLITSSQPMPATSNVQSRWRFWNKCIRCRQHDNVGKDLTGCRHRNRMFSPCSQVPAAKPNNNSAELVLHHRSSFSAELISQEPQALYQLPSTLWPLSKTQKTQPTF